MPNKTDYIPRQSVIDLLHYHADEACSAIVADVERIPGICTGIANNNMKPICPVCGKEMHLVWGYHPTGSEYKVSFSCCGMFTPCGKGNTKDAAIKNAQYLAYNP